MKKYIFVLGVVSLLTDISSEMVFAILPIFLEKFLYASKTQIGIIEGFAAFLTSFLKVISGYLSDKIGKRKLLVVFGYFLSTFTKPLLFFAISWIHVFWIRAKTKSRTYIQSDYFTGRKNKVSIQAGFKRRNQLK